MTTVVLVACLVWLSVWLITRGVGYSPRPRPLPRPHPGPPLARPRRRVRADVPHALYHYDHAERPGRIYVGVSNEPEVRHQRHVDEPGDQWWLARSTGVMVIDQWYPNRPIAFAVERDTIRAAVFAGEDLANDHHHPFRRRVRRAA